MSTREERRAGETEAAGGTDGAPTPRRPRAAPGPREAAGEASGAPDPGAVPEIGGPSGPEPTRYGDWERGGRCIDF